MHLKNFKEKAETQVIVSYICRYVRIWQFGVASIVSITTLLNLRAIWCFIAP